MGVSIQDEQQSSSAEKCVNMENACKAVSRLIDTSDNDRELEIAMYRNKQIFMSTLRALAKIVCPFRKDEIVLLPPLQGERWVQRGRITEITSVLSAMSNEPCLPNLLYILSDECGLYKIVVKLVNPDGTPKKRYRTRTLSRSIQLEIRNGKTPSPTFDEIYAQKLKSKEISHDTTA